MKLAVFNGSPRGKDSNTKVLLEHFINGFMKTDGNTYEVAYLIRVKDRGSFINLFQEAEQVLLAFPLYDDAMPAIVKTFIESLEPLCRREGNPDIGFIVQSGFPEAIHSRYVERYLAKLAARLGWGLVPDPGRPVRVPSRVRRAGRRAARLSTCSSGAGRTSLRSARATWGRPGSMRYRSRRRTSMR